MLEWRWIGEYILEHIYNSKGREKKREVKQTGEMSNLIRIFKLPFHDAQYVRLLSRCGGEVDGSRPA